ncbi:CotS family spore coat protein [Candidatus Formimonas warabiya]|uniref:Aminoglycoside phosphotransferase domain-containing protein n=1 Tax=Formimonas warabiya TaxID=1761012 RepID=A0A3G1KT98_FORW1|nr:CotS family spore coat protein [Candidatus Formimonas warabiya]ATW25733.1 hypothetical protein DCMF_14040 [Candidatus Formimonas warabiya]
MKEKAKKMIYHHWRKKVKKVSKFGPVWKVKTKHGQYCLKRWKHGKARLLFAYQVIEQLWERGYSRTPRLLPAVNGLPYAKNDEDIFVLTKWVGRPLRGESKTEWTLAAKELAAFHLMSQNIYLPPQVERYYFSGKWLFRFPKRIKEMKEAFDRFKNPQNIFEEEVSKDAPLVLETAEAALELLRKSAYQSMVEEIYTRPMLCHGNIKAKNFTIDDDGAVFVIDFDSFRLDLPVQDLSALFFAALSCTGWSLPFARTLFESYHVVRPVKQEEIPILKAILLFPDDVYKTIHKYCQGEKSPESSLKKWQKEFSRFIQQRLFYKKWFSWLGQDDI